MRKTKSASDKAIEVISKNHLSPIPAWEFRLRDWGVWLFWGLAVVTGGVAVAVTDYMMKSNDWDLYYVPYFWLLGFLTSMGLAYFGFRKTKKGYRYGMLKIAIWEIGLSLILGVMLAGVGAGSKIDAILAKDIPGYRQIVPLKTQQWTRPEEGFLSGVITRVNTNNKVEIRDFDGKSWNIDVSGAIIRGRVILKPGEEVKIIGHLVAKGQFAATEIRPWAGIGRGRY
jgi:hypothetical protein